jgi:hypothetical protein
MVRGLLTDARKTSYAICNSLLTCRVFYRWAAGDHSHSVIVTRPFPVDGGTGGMICNEENEARGLRGRSNSQQLACKRAFGTAPNSR